MITSYHRSRIQCTTVMQGAQPVITCHHPFILCMYTHTAVGPFE